MDLGAFESFCKQQASPLERCFRAKNVAAHDGADLSQEALQIVWQKCGRSHPGKEKHFLFGVAARLGAKYHTQNARHQQTRDSLSRHSETAAQSPAHGVDEAERAAQVHQALAKLPPKLRTVVEDVFLNQKSHRETAEGMGKRLSTFCRFPAYIHRSL